MWEQAKALQEGAEIVVCTPVRDVPPSVCQSGLFPDHFLSLCLEGPPDRPR